MIVSRRQFIKTLAAVPMFGAAASFPQISAAPVVSIAKLVAPEIYTLRCEELKTYGADFVLLYALMVNGGYSFQFDRPFAIFPEDHAAFLREHETFILKIRGIEMVRFPLDGAREIISCLSCRQDRLSVFQYRIEKVTL